METLVWSPMGFLIPVLHHISVVMFKKFVSLHKKMYSSQNKFAVMIAADARSLISKNMQLISKKYNIDIKKLLHNNVPCHALNSVITDKCSEIVSVLKELRAASECTYVIPGFSAEEIRFMYEFTSTF